MRSWEKDACPRDAPKPTGQEIYQPEIFFVHLYSKCQKQMTILKPLNSLMDQQHISLDSILSAFINHIAISSWSKRSSNGKAPLGLVLNRDFSQPSGSSQHFRKAFYGQQGYSCKANRLIAISQIYSRELREDAPGNPGLDYVHTKMLCGKQ